MDADSWVRVRGDSSNGLHNAPRISLVNATKAIPGVDLEAGYAGPVVLVNTLSTTSAVIVCGGGCQAMELDILPKRLIIRDVRRHRGKRATG